MGQGSLSVSKESERGFQTCGTADARTGGEQCSRPGREGGRDGRCQIRQCLFQLPNAVSPLPSPLLSLTLSYPVHNWPDCPARLTDHPGSLAYLRRTGAVRRSPGRQDTHSYLLYNVTAKSDLTQVDTQRDSLPNLT